jgi:hypothetical protein
MSSHPFDGAGGLGETGARRLRGAVALDPVGEMGVVTVQHGGEQVVQGVDDADRKAIGPPGRHVIEGG